MKDHIPPRKELSDLIPLYGILKSDDRLFMERCPSLGWLERIKDISYFSGIVILNLGYGYVGNFLIENLNK